jgi:ribosomal protein S18 acetylase RimI-like enzyme
MTAGELADASTLVFEYMATTQGERGRPVPATPDELPPILRAEQADLLAAYRHPGVLLLAYDGPVAVGCVGLKPGPGSGIAAVTRLYVRPAYRGAGVARTLMAAVSDRARANGFAELVLDVMASRVQVIAFYQRLGFTETAPPAVPLTDDAMVYLRRTLSPLRYDAR